MFSSNQLSCIRRFDLARIAHTHLLRDDQILAWLRQATGENIS